MRTLGACIGRPIFHGKIVCIGGAKQSWRDQKVVAFAAQQNALPKGVKSVGSPKLIWERCTELNSNLSGCQQGTKWEPLGSWDSRKIAPNPTLQKRKYFKTIVYPI